VLVVESGKAQKRTLQLGETSEGRVEVRRGLVGGEDLILNPSGVRVGDAVRGGS
jgi:hypothetical protein